MEARQKLEKQLAKEAPRDHLGCQSLGLHGKENGCYVILGLYRDNGKENGNYYITWGNIGIMEKEWKLLERGCIGLEIYRRYVRSCGVIYGLYRG